MTDLIRHASPVPRPQGLAWDGATMWVTSAANGRLYELDWPSLNVKREFVPPFESLGITYTGSDFRVILAPAIDDPDLERDHRYVFRFSPDAGFSECFACPDTSGSMLACANGTLYVSQAYAMKLIELDEAGTAVREMQLDRRPVGMTILDDTFYLVTVDDDWNDGRFDRLVLHDDVRSLQPLFGLPFKPRSVAFDGTRFWTADRNNEAIVSLNVGD